MATWHIAFPRDEYVLVTIAGELTWPQILQAYREYRARPEFRRGMNALWDLRDAHLAVSVDEVRAAVDVYSSTLDERGTNHSVAYVVNRDVDFGVLRMFEAYAGRLPYEAGVFRTLPEAEAWLEPRLRPRG
ncbi:MAG: hypothetical protein AB7O67_13510 [Vicinamibacterales bacterium]